MFTQVQATRRYFFLFLFLSFSFLFFLYDGISLDRGSKEKKNDRGSNISSDGPRVLTVN